MLQTKPDQTFPKCSKEIAKEQRVKIQKFENPISIQTLATRM
jgi:hypothetical protein